MISCDSGKWVLLQLVKQLIGIPGETIREMVSLPDVTRLPGAPDHIGGVINLRGQIIPVLDLRILTGFQLQGKTERKSRSLIASLMLPVCGCLVELGS